MAQSDWKDDYFIIKIGGEDYSRKLKYYRVELSVFRQPGTFVARTGYDGALAKELQKASLGAPYELRVQRSKPNKRDELEIDLPMQTGAIDAFDIMGDGPSEIEYRGRDAIAPLVRGYFLNDQSFSESSYYDLTAAAMRLAGQDPDELLLTGETGRKKAITGSKEVKTSAASIDASTLIIEEVEGSKTKRIPNVIRGNVGANILGWLREQYRKAALFVWALPNGQVALSQPNPNQEPLFKLERIRGATRETCPIINLAIKNDVSEVHSEIHVFGRSGGGVGGRRRIHEFVKNDLMISNNLVGKISYEEDVRTSSEARNIAIMRMAEELRGAFKLEVKVSGHTFPSSINGGLRVPWQTNQIVQLRDELTGLSGPFYIGDVVFERMSKTTTTLTLYRPADLRFA